jgi:ABC-type multidrug transport system ATPase subunit
MRLAAAIVHQPKVLFLDEPGSNLDEKGRMLIESLVAEFKEVDKLVIIASNNPDELALCNRVYSVEEERFLK